MPENQSMRAITVPANKLTANRAVELDAKGNVVINDKQLAKVVQEGLSSAKIPKGGNNPAAIRITIGIDF